MTTKMMLNARMKSMTFASPLKSSSCCILKKIKMKAEIRGGKLVLLFLISKEVGIDYAMVVSVTL